MTNKISVKGANEHNLKNVSLDIPKNTVTVITGLSGSGKSSLAFDTIYAEGQRRYVESLSAYARQFLNMSGKPDVERIDGLSPAIAIDQKTTSKNPRSTVGTITEIYDYLRLLYANVGTPHCPHHHVPIEAQTISQMVDQVTTWPEGTRLQVLAPVVRGRKGEYRKEIKEWQQQGFTRLRVDGETYAIEDAPELEKNIKHDIDVVVDRLAIKPDNTSRLAESLEIALKLAEGTAKVEEVVKTGEAREFIFSENQACPICGHAVPALEPRLFSFNSPFGACKTCDGLGEESFFDPALIVPDPSLTLRKGAVAPWRNGTFSSYYITALTNHYKFSIDTPFNKLPERIQNIILYGSDGEALQFSLQGKKGQFATEKPFDGVVNILERRWVEAGNPLGREDLNKYRSTQPCPTCHGNRLNADAAAVKVGGMNITEFSNLSIAEALKTAEKWQTMFKGADASIATPILREITSRLGFLNHVGLEYLTLARKSGTLSGGESQRIRLASQIGSGLTGVLYVLDEPSIGLHQRDNNRLLETLEKLRDLDNTILVVEHDEDAMRMADHVIDMGPRAGIHGGEVIAAGTAEEICAVEGSLTGQYLSGKRSIETPAARRKVDMSKNITVENASGNNLKNVTAAFPLGVMTCVTGVSGSGKSTLVMDTLLSATARRLNGSKAAVEPHKAIKGLEHIDKVVNIDQSPIGRTPRSNPATYTGVMGPIREWFAKLPEAQAKGYTAGRFSFNVKGGRCEACSGDGLVKVEMHFLADVYVPCDVCGGRRYNRETLQIKYKGHSIADVLEMTVEEACELFREIPSIYSKLKTLMDVGLSYIHLGQSATTLSGGEAQRIKLAKELSKRSTGRTLYILDEPTTGLHFEDINQLLKVLHRLVDEGNTMVIIEHNLDVIKTADHLIDIGPEGGNKGGKIIAEGTPEKVAATKGSHTGEFLAPMLSKKKGRAA